MVPLSSSARDWWFSPSIRKDYLTILDTSFKWIDVSYAQCHQIRSVDFARIIKRIGKLPDEYLKIIRNTITSLIYENDIY